MKKWLLLSMIMVLTSTSVLADQVYVVHTTSDSQTVMDTIEAKTKETAQKTGKAVKEGAIKAGEATKKGAIKAGKATKRGAKKVTNWSAKKIKKGAEKIIEKTDTLPDQEVVKPSVEPKDPVIEQ